MLQEQRIKTSDLLNFMGQTPADNVEGLAESVPWKSEAATWYLENVFKYENYLDSLCRSYMYFAPVAAVAHWQRLAWRTLVTDPIRKNVQLSVRLRKEPDIFRDTNSWIYRAYGKLLFSLTEHVMTDDRFDREKAEQLVTTPRGRERLKFFAGEFARLEKAYTARGLTRLRAMKTLLECLLMVITATPLEGRRLPYMPYDKDGVPTKSWEEYLADNYRRFENLYQANAFDPKEYARRATRGKIGCTPFEIVADSAMRTATLRRYLLPEGVTPNGWVLYLSSPLINKPEIFDLAPGKSVVEGLIREGFTVYMVDYGQPTGAEQDVGLDYYSKTIPDAYLELITRRHPRQKIGIVGYCMGGALILPYLARRAEERYAAGLSLDIERVCLMAAPIKFDDGASGQGQMRSYIKRNYNTYLMEELFKYVNVPPQVIDYGLSEIQPGVQHNVLAGFYERAVQAEALEDAAPFLFWLTHGTRFPLRAHREWLGRFFLGNEVMEGTYCLPSRIAALDGRPVNMGMLAEAGVALFDYRGTRDPIAPAGSCVASETWGRVGTGNRTVEKNIGHIFVVSKKLLGEFLAHVRDFFLGK